MKFGSLTHLRKTKPLKGVMGTPCSGPGLFRTPKVVTRALRVRGALIKYFSLSSSWIKNVSNTVAVPTHFFKMFARCNDSTIMDLSKCREPITVTYILPHAWQDGGCFEKVFFRSEILCSYFFFYFTFFLSLKFLTSQKKIALG